MNFKDLFEKVLEYGGDNLPTICASFATTTSLGALWLGITSQKKVDEKITDDMTTAEKAGVYLEEQAGTVVVEALTVGAICLGRHASQVKIDKLEASVASALNLACMAWNRSKLIEEKTKEIVGEEKAEEIKKAVSNEQVCKIPISDRSPDIYLFEDQEFNCYFYMPYRDFITGLYAAEAHFNRTYSITVAEIYYFLGKKAPEGSDKICIDMDTVAEEWADHVLPVSPLAMQTPEGVNYYVICYNTTLQPAIENKPHTCHLMLDDR